MSSSMERYDLVLVMGYFRRLTYYLSLIRYMTPRCRVGLLLIPIDDYLYQKHKTTQDEFVARCVQAGAEIVERLPAEARITLVPQQPYLPEAYARIEQLHTRRFAAAMGFAWAGCHDEFIERLRITNLYVIQRSFFDFLLKQRNKEGFLNDKEVVEVGLPYQRYPIFDDFSCDYLLAMPTPFSFSTERDKWMFLEYLLQLLDRIGPHDVVVHKPHNAMDYDYFSGKTARRMVRALRWIPAFLMARLLKGLARLPLSFLQTAAGRLYTEWLYQRVLWRTVPMEKVTADHLLAMEAFLPGVRKGVIGGLSNTMWGALFFRLPFYNCVDLEAQDRGGEDTLYKNDASKFLDLNLQFFYVPCCRGWLEFDPRYFDVIDDSTRAGDLIADLQKEIERLAGDAEGAGDSPTAERSTLP